MGVLRGMNKQIMQYSYEEITRLKNAEQNKNETITLDHGDWLWDNETDNFVDSELKTVQDEPVRIDWRTVLQADWVKYVAIFAGILLFVSAFAAEGTIALGGLWWLFLLIPLMSGRGVNMDGWGKWILFLLFINLFTGGAFGFWFFFLPFFFWGGGQRRRTYNY